MNDRCKSAFQHLTVRLLTKSNQKHLAAANGRRPQIACRSEEMSGQRVVVGRLAIHVEGDELLALGNHDFVSRFGQCQRFGASFALFAGVGNRCRLEVIFLKEPLSLAA
jgi:hypothetical protein